MAKLTEIRLDGYKSSAWLVVGHHHFMKHSRKLDCHMNVFLQLHATFQLMLKQVRSSFKSSDLRVCLDDQKTGNNVTIYHFIGRGKSKKEAKRLAAHQMWQRLQDMPVDSQDCQDVADEVSIQFRAVNDVKCPRCIRPLHGQMR